MLSYYMSLLCASMRHVDLQVVRDLSWLIHAPPVLSEQALAPNSWRFLAVHGH